MAGATYALTSTAEVAVGTGTFGIPLTGRMVAIYNGVWHLYAIGQTDTNVSLGLHGELPDFTLNAVGGAQTGELTLPFFTLTASGTTTSFGEVIAILPQPTLVASGTTTALGRAILTLPHHFTLRAYGGAAGRRTLPHFTLSAHGITGATSTARLHFPLFALAASGTVGSVGSLIAELPVFTIGSTSRLTSRLPFFTLRATGFADEAVTYEAYSHAFIEDGVAVTRYTNYPFEQIVRFGGKYYGVALDGLFELVGDTFDDVPIVAVVRTGETDFKARELKRPISLYLAGRVGGDFHVSVQEAEVKEYTYNYHPVNKTGARNYRVFFGKGMRARYLTYTLTNINGEDFELDEITPEVAVLRRTA